MSETDNSSEQSNKSGDEDEDDSAPQQQHTFQLGYNNYNLHQPINKYYRPHVTEAIVRPMPDDYHPSTVPIILEIEQGMRSFFKKLRFNPTSKEARIERIRGCDKRLRKIYDGSLKHQPSTQDVDDGSAPQHAPMTFNCAA